MSKDEDGYLARTAILIMIAATLFVSVAVIETYPPHLVIQIAVYISLVLLILVAGLILTFL